MPKICVAGGCSNRKSDTISLHRFPINNSKRCALWNRFVKVKRADWRGPSEHSVLCSAHFLETDFDRTLQHEMGFSKNRVLKDDAVPTIHASISRPTQEAIESSKKTSGSVSEEPVRKKPRKAVVKLSGHRRLQETVLPQSSSQSAESHEAASVDVGTASTGPQESLGTDVAPREPPPNAGTSKCTCTCSIHQPPQAQPEQKHTMPRAVQAQPTMRSKGCTARPKTQCASTQTDLAGFDKTIVMIPSTGDTEGPTPPVSSGPVHETLSSNLVADSQGVVSSTPKKEVARQTSPHESPISSPVSSTEEQQCSVDPDYYPSNLSLQEAFDEAQADSDMFSDMPLRQECSQEEDMFLVSRSSLDSLLAVCAMCTGPCDTVFSTDTDKPRNGTAITVQLKCQNCKYQRVWASQYKVGRMYVGNIIASAALLFSGSQYAKVARLFSYMRVPFISKSTFIKHQNELLFPAVLDTWANQQQELFQKVQAMEGPATLGGDGRADSPGHSAKYGTYTTMELRLSKVIDVQLVQSNEVKSSYWMEPEGLKRSIGHLENNQIDIGAIVTDRHRTIAKWLRDQKGHVRHHYDIWHIAKGLGKKLDKLALQKDCQIVRDWKKSIINHLYWCAASTPDGDGAVMIAKWNSLMNHLQNQHEGHSDPLFPRCLHDNLDTPGRKKKWFIPGSKAAVLLEKILQDTWLLKDVRQLSPIQQTSSVEGFHSTILHFAPKHTAFHYMAMKCRVILAAMHFNENADRKRAYRKDGEKLLTVYFSKSKKGEPSVRWEKTSATHSYGHSLVAAVLMLAGENRSGLSKSQESYPIPPPLAAAMQHVDRAAAREQFGAYHRYGSSLDDGAGPS